MKNLIALIMGTLLLMSCSSNPYKEQFNLENQLAESILENSELPKKWPVWVHQSGVDGSVIYMVGTYETDNLETPEHHMYAAASMNARGLVLQDAPSQYKAVIQSAIGQASGTYGSFNKVENAVIQVNGLTGFRTNQRRSACILKKRATSTSVKLVKSCKVQGYISIQALNRAYEDTMAQLYGKEKSNKFKDILEKSFENNMNFTSEKRVPAQVPKISKK